MKIILGLSCLLLCAGVLVAGELSTPPPLPSEPVAEQNYFQRIFDHWQKLVVVTANPNGSRRGTRGELVYGDFGGEQRLCANTNTASGGGTSWECVTLAAP